LAKIADTLIMFNDIEASFVIANLKGNAVGISSRSIGNLNVGEILEKIGGGGDVHEAAAKLTNRTIEEVSIQLSKLID
jgi:c-di-AMP phosphodiesterase-like protein